MRSTVLMWVAKTGYIILSVSFCVLGLILVLLPEVSPFGLNIACGILFTAFGIVKILGYCSKDLFRLAFQYDLEFGILMILPGVLLLLHPSRPFSLICTGLGVLVLADALFKIRITLEAKKFGIRTWWLVLTIALAAAALGVVLILRPQKILVHLIGFTLMAEGLMSMSTALAMVKIIRHQIKD